MQINTNFQDLRDAIGKEQIALANMDKNYCDLIVKMLKFQAGVGYAPSLEDFTEWRDSVDIRAEFSRLRELICP